MLGEVIRITRIANDMSISTLSEKSAVSKSYITEIEKGKKRPSDCILSKLSFALDLTEQDLQKFDELHNSLIKTKKDLYAYRKLLIRILKFYANKERLGSEMETNIIQPSHISRRCSLKNNR